MVKVVHIQYSTTSGGSAALRLQKAFIKSGIDSVIVSLQSDKFKNNNITYLGRKQKLIAKIGSRIESYLTRHVIKELGLFSYPLLGINVAKMEEIQNADYIYIHWAQNGFLSLKNIEQLAKLNKPLIIFMHDMWSVSGGCHYSFTCEKYITGCNNCPMFPVERKNTLAAKEFKAKAKLYAKYNNLYFISPSKWLYNCAKQSLLLKNKPVFYIPNVLDTTLFKPFDKKISKVILNINTAETVIAFGAITVDSVRKGWAYLQKALEILQEDPSLKKIRILIFGSSYNKRLADAIPFKTRFMGYLKDEYSTALAYNAADVFVVPSLADNQPTTIAESLSCCTPVVGFDVGGIPDMIKHKENGYLAKYKNAEDLAEGIKFCLQNNVKGFMLPVFEPSLTIQKHLELFSHINSLKEQQTIL